MMLKCQYYYLLLKFWILHSFEHTIYYSSTMSSDTLYMLLHGCMYYQLWRLYLLSHVIHVILSQMDMYACIFFITSICIMYEIKTTCQMCTCMVCYMKRYVDTKLTLNLNFFQVHPIILYYLKVKIKCNLNVFFSFFLLRHF